MSTEPKFCKDCKHFNAAWPDSCNQPPERELIHGRKTPANPTRMRAEDGACKPEALLWEEKLPEVPMPAMPTFVEAMHGPSEMISGEMISAPASTATRWWEFWK